MTTAHDSHQHEKTGQQQLEFAWCPRTLPTSALEKREPAQCTVESSGAACLSPRRSALPMFRGLPLPEPRPEAVAYGVFGLEETGPIEPDEEQIIALVDQQGLELLGVLVDLSAAREGLRTGIDPRTGRTPRTELQRIRLTERLHETVRRLAQTREDILGVYADAFGEENATLLDEHVQLWLTGRLTP